MPTRRLPYSTTTRFKALKAAKEHKDLVPPPSIIPYKGNTITQLDTFYPLYKGKIEAMELSLLNQLGISHQLKTARPRAELFITHFYDALQNAIARGTFLEEVRTVYGLAGNDGKLPQMDSEAEINYWGGKAATGEAARLLLPGAMPITFPSIAEVNTVVNAFNTLNLAQAEAKAAYNVGQEGIAADAPIADMLILKMWNETEAEFDTGDKPNMRQKSREWGVVYVPTAGEAPDPNEFSVQGKITVQGLTTAVEDVEIKVLQTGETTLSESNGNYLVSYLIPGTYTLEITKSGFEVETLTGIVVSAGNITTLNIALNPVININGAVSGVVRLAAMPVAGVTIGIQGWLCHP